jgi:hypothetical protein
MITDNLTYINGKFCELCIFLKIQLLFFETSFRVFVLCIISLFLLLFPSMIPEICYSLTAE